MKLNFVQTKKVFDIYRKLCSGQRDVNLKLVKKFEKETKDGLDITKHTNLLKTAIEELIDKKKEIGAASLFSKGGTSMEEFDYNGVEDFELISFLVLE